MVLWFGFGSLSPGLVLAGLLWDISSTTGLVLFPLAFFSERSLNFLIASLTAEFVLRSPPPNKYWFVYDCLAAV